MAGSVNIVECKLEWWVAPFLIIATAITAPVWAILPHSARNRVVDFVGSVAARGITVISE